MYSSGTIHVEVRDVTDAGLIADVNQTVRHMLSHLPGTWHVVISASDERGRWDLRLRGGSGSHFARFIASPDHLAECAVRRLRAYLQAVVPPRWVVHRPGLMPLPAEGPRSIDRSPGELPRPSSKSQRIAS